MKFTQLLIYVLLSTTLFGQTLNQFGHIVEDTKASKHKVIDKDGTLKIAHKDLMLNGNSLFELSEGYATIENTCGDTPSKLTFYDENGLERASSTYAQTINLTVDPTGNHIYFLNKGKTVIINIETFEERTITSESDIAINQSGQPIYFDNEKNVLVTDGSEIKLSFTPMKIELDAEENVYVFGRNKYAFIENDEPEIRNYNSGTFFRSKTIRGKVFWVEKNRSKEAFNFKMYNLANNEVKKETEQTLSTNKLSTTIDSQNQKRSGTQILCPLNPNQPNYPHPVGNSYGEHQNYGGNASSAYLHPGIDLLGSPGQPVYATMDGVVKAVLTTSADLHWRLALGLTNTAQQQDGYLFAHLQESSIPFSVGDAVQAGDFLGYLVEWPNDDFHHLHFARLTHSGQVWDGNWLTKDNVLADIINFTDQTAPVFEDLWQGNTVAFRTPNGNQVLQPNNLSGQFDIICNIHDKINSNWRVDVNSIWFQIIKPENNCVVYEQNSFEYNFLLDTYDNGVEGTAILNTIYSTSGNWNTLGNYNTRQFYQNISRSNGDGVINSADQNVYFDSNQLPNGTYTIKVFADDAAGNTSSTEEVIVINNAAGVSYDVNCVCNGGAYADSDGDGVCDSNDVCPNGDDTADSDGDGTPDGCDNCNSTLIGTACSDGDSCTTGETYDANCNCTGGTSADTDGDGICDANDQCQGTNDNVIGTSCNDNNPCTTGDVYNSACNCSGTFVDSDGDGVCDTNDICPNGDDNTDNNNNGLPDACEPCPIYDFNAYPVLGYDPGQDFGPWEVQDGGVTLYMTGNAWKAIDISYNITPQTVITFDFKSTVEGEIHELGFDNDLLLNRDQALVVYGNQGYAGTLNNSTYSGSGNWESFTVDIGAQFTGSYQYLVLTADDDANSAGDSYYRNIKIFEDTDGDLACDVLCTPGTACNDGDACTTGETYDNGCNCVGGTVVDTDGDNVCDANDQCSGTDDSIIGTSCDDGNACTTGDAYDSTCNCAGTFADADGDGICDANDICTSGDDNADADNDGTPDACDPCNNNLTGSTCDDGNACTTGETYDENCNCTGGVFMDSDGDGVCDANDDTNGNCTLDGTCDDGDVNTINDVYDANCDCSGTVESILTCDTAPTYNGANSYVAGDRVIYQGTLYERTATSWIVIEQCGQDGCDTAPTWNSSTSYTVGDQVIYQGRLYERTTTGWIVIGQCNGANRLSNPTNVTLPGGELSSIPNSNNVKISPNPVKDIAQIHFNSSIESEASIELRAANGATLSRIISPAAQGFNTQQIDLSGLPVGLYFINLQTSNYNQSVKVLKVD